MIIVALYFLLFGTFNRFFSVFNNGIIHFVVSFVFWNAVIETSLDQKELFNQSLNKA